ncbi:MAG: DUF3806 domain-containing protein [Chthoniobacter sp.]|nr:DUF3806 domain-containing protein [Chthoniobacter sp.]
MRDHFHITLDWSDESIKQIEAVMKTMHDDLKQAKPTPEQVTQFAKMFGSNVGEVYRKNHGATWGMVELDGQRFPGMQKKVNGRLFRPVLRAQKRLAEGAEFNVWDYYRGILEP